jgi:hypothetical protein
MKRSAFLFAMAAIALLFASDVNAQLKVREDDHFTRSLVVSRIDLDEKINQPIVQPTEASLYANASHQGLIDALMRGLKDGSFLAYHPENLQQSLSWEDVQIACESLLGEGMDNEWEELENNYDEGCDWCGDEEDEVEEIESDGYTAGSSIYGETTAGMTADGYFNDEIIAPMSTVVELIENRIFDKNRSDMVYDIQYIRLVWVDPGETLPDRNVICLRYEDVMATLEACQWTNRFNEAEHRNLRVFL